MKLLSVILTVIFLASTTSVAQARYALQNPSEIPTLLINIAMAAAILMLLSNLQKLKLINKEKILGFFNLKRGYSRKAYRVS